MSLLQKRREISLQILYAMLVNPSREGKKAEVFSSLAAISKKQVCELIRRAEKILARQKKFDTLIENVAEGFTLQRMTYVERSVIYLIFYEIFEESLPVEVGIHEAIRLVKKFSQEESVHFVHAILDKGIKHLLFLSAS